MRAETARLANLAETRHRRMVEAREAIRPLILAAASLNAQANQFISAWLDRNDCLWSRSTITITITIIITIIICCRDNFFGENFRSFTDRKLARTQQWKILSSGHTWVLSLTSSKSCIWFIKENTLKYQAVYRRKPPSLIVRFESLIYSIIPSIVVGLISCQLDDTSKNFSWKSHPFYIIIRLV